MTPQSKKQHRALFFLLHPLSIYLSQKYNRISYLPSILNHLWCHSIYLFIHPRNVKWFHIFHLFWIIFAPFYLSFYPGYIKELPSILNHLCHNSIFSRNRIICMECRLILISKCNKCNDMLYWFCPFARLPQTKYYR